MQDQLLQGGIVLVGLESQELPQVQGGLKLICVRHGEFC